MFPKFSLSLSLVLLLCCIYVPAECQVVATTDWIVPALTQLSPWPTSWVQSASLSSWAGFQLCADGVHWTINFTASLSSSFAINHSTIRLDLLPVNAPLCAIYIAPPLTVSHNVAVFPSTLTTFVVSLLCVDVNRVQPSLTSHGYLRHCNK